MALSRVRPTGTDIKPENPFPAVTPPRPRTPNITGGTKTPKEEERSETTLQSVCMQMVLNKSSGPRRALSRTDRESELHLNSQFCSLRVPYTYGSPTTR